MIRFVLQLCEGHRMHRHVCPCCKEVRGCSFGDCAGITFQTCKACLGGTDCPVCLVVAKKRYPMDLTWVADDLDGSKVVRTKLAGMCNRCGFLSPYSDHHDGMGPLRTRHIHVEPCGCTWTKEAGLVGSTGRCSAHRNGGGPVPGGAG